MNRTARCRTRAAVPSRSRALGLGIIALCGVASAPTLAEAPAHLSAWQEIVFLTIMKVRNAADACHFRSNDGGVDALLTAAAMNRDDIDPRRAPPSVLRQITADQDAYQGDRDTACSEAWARFGPDGAPGVRDLLGR